MNEKIILSWKFEVILTVWHHDKPPSVYVGAELSPSQHSAAIVYLHLDFSSKNYNVTMLLLVSSFIKRISQKNWSHLTKTDERFKLNKWGRSENQPEIVSY